jgi:hypothetical protein
VMSCTNHHPPRHGGVLDFSPVIGILRYTQTIGIWSSLSNAAS